MESRAKLTGHAIHPMLIVFPLGLFATALIFDLIARFGGATGLALVAFWNIAAGIIGGLVAAIFGLWDWLHIPAGTRAKSLGIVHGVGNVVIVVLFAVSWLLRSGDPSQLPGTLHLVLEVVAVLLALGTAWLGGELVERLGVGVDPGANPDAPSSLAGPIPARSEASREPRPPRAA